jgi:hypothetical protein
MQAGRRLLEQPLAGQPQALAAAGRHLTTKTTIRQLKLPACTFGPRLNFIGRFTGDAVGP